MNFRKFPVKSGKASSGISGKEDKLARYTEIFGNFSSGISVPCDFPPEIFEVFGWMVCFSENVICDNRY